MSGVSRLFFRFILLIAACFVVLLGWREIQIRSLPQDEVRIFPPDLNEMMEIPPRPGIKGLMITGPRIEPLYFSIDLAKSGIRSLDWRRLQIVDPNADVKINGQINEAGRLTFSSDDISMEGHTEAGLIIQNTMKTWLFTPYKNGRIEFWFNLPSKGRKLVINTKELIRRASVPAHVPIYNGRLHFIEYVPQNEIKVISH
ncbi:hypothetical protein HQ585_08875 [candidate division KSB1 bacterium]|nr:hypothetical protein [candidate division KSB1 bacterium]